MLRITTTNNGTQLAVSAANNEDGTPIWTLFSLPTPVAASLDVQLLTVAEKTAYRDLAQTKITQLRVNLQEALAEALALVQ